MRRPFSIQRPCHSGGINPGEFALPISVSGRMRPPTGGLLVERPQQPMGAWEGRRWGHLPARVARVGPGERPSNEQSNGNHCDWAQSQHDDARSNNHFGHDTRPSMGRSKYAAAEAAQSAVCASFSTSLNHASPRERTRQSGVVRTPKLTREPPEDHRRVGPQPVSRSSALEFGDCAGTPC